MKRTLRKLELLLFPLKKNDRLYGNSIDFGITSTIERRMHGLRDVMDMSVRGEDTYRLQIKNDQMPYFICNSQTLYRPLQGYFVWAERIQVRRIDKKKLSKMFVNGLIRREK